MNSWHIKLMAHKNLNKFVIHKHITIILFREKVY